MYHATPLPWTRSRQGPFAPPELPGLNTTTAPSDSCSGPIAVMSSLDQSRRVPRNPTPPEQVSQVPDRSVDARRPLSPRGARPLRVLVTSRPVSGFTQSGRMATPILRNEAESGSRFRITADAFAFSGFDGVVTRAAAESASWRTSNSHGQFLSTDKICQA
jgi:hypothetical protein